MKTKFLQLEFLGDYSKYILPVFGAKGEKVGVFGTAFLISPHFAITAHHVFKEYLKYFHLPNENHADFEMKLLRVKNPETYKEYEKIEAIDSFLLIKSVKKVGSSDIALLELNNPVDKYLRISFQPPYIGKRVYCMGYPKSIVDHRSRQGGVFEIGIDPRVSDGYVSSCTPERHSNWRPFPIFETLLELQGGMSGSPIFDDSSSVIGMAMSSLNTSDQHGNYSSFFALLAPLLGIDIDFDGKTWKFDHYLRKVNANPEGLDIFDIDLRLEKYKYTGSKLDWIT